MQSNKQLPAVELQELSEYDLTITADTAWPIKRSIESGLCYLTPEIFAEKITKARALYTGNESNDQATTWQHRGLFRQLKSYVRLPTLHEVQRHGVLETLIQLLESPSGKTGILSLKYNIVRSLTNLYVKSDKEAQTLVALTLKTAKQLQAAQQPDYVPAKPGKYI